tara:strand:+ start:258 stop:473 length:216 start_codon:yes stop_codon:yes gene_type:complete
VFVIFEEIKVKEIIRFLKIYLGFTALVLGLVTAIAVIGTLFIVLVGGVNMALPILLTGIITMLSVAKYNNV